MSENIEVDTAMAQRSVVNESLYMTHQGNLEPILTSINKDVTNSSQKDNVQSSDQVVIDMPSDPSQLNVSYFNSSSSTDENEVENDVENNVENDVETEEVENNENVVTNIPTHSGCYTGFVDCLRHVFCCTRPPSDEDVNSKRSDSTATTNDNKDPYYRFNDQTNEQENINTSGSITSFIRGLRGLRHRSKNSKHQKTVNHLNNAFDVALEESDDKIPTRKVRKQSTIVKMVQSTDHSQSSTSKSNDDNYDNDDNDDNDDCDNAESDTMTAIPAANTSDTLTVTIDTQNNAQTNSQANSQEISDDNDNNDNIDIETAEVVAIKTTEVPETADSMESSESSESSENKMEQMEKEVLAETITEEVSESIETKVNLESAIMDPEIVKANLEIISSLQPGNKLYEDYSGRLSVDNSFVPGLSRILSRNSRTNTVARVIKTIRDAKVLAVFHPEISTLINEKLTKGLQNLIQTYSESSGVKGSLSILANKLIGEQVNGTPNM